MIENKLTVEFVQFPTLPTYFLGVWAVWQPLMFSSFCVVSITALVASTRPYKLISSTHALACSSNNYAISYFVIFNVRKFLKK